jgi:predicted nucleic acid-binding protein
MRVYWDSTAVLNALAAQSVLARLDEGEHLTRSHAYAEAFHHLSGRGLPLKDGQRLAVTPRDAARMIRNLAKKVQAHDLAPEQTLTALDDAQSQGVSGRMVHDWLHARAAKLAGADVVLTRDGALSRLCAAEGLKAQWP